jgi:outer membrane lipoprotein SlyB
MSATQAHPSHSGVSLLIVLPLTLLLAACGQKYSPDTYSSSAVQQASKVESGVIVGVRKVAISADPTIASATGAAAGGIAGSQVSEGAYSALSALGGAVVGGLAGSEAGHKIQDTYGYEYIVRNAKGDLLSVTQKDTTPLKVGQRVLLIQGSQARVVNDYTEHVDTDFSASPDKAKSANDTKPDLSKDSGGPATPPAPAALSETEQMMNAAAAAAAAAAVAAITAEGMKDKDKSAAPAAATPAPATTATPAPEGTTIVAQPDDAATDPASAAPVATPPAAPASQPAGQAKPAPATTIVVPEPTQTTKPGTTTTSASTAPATGAGTRPTTVKPVKDTPPAAKAETEEKTEEAPADADKDATPADADAATNKSEPAPAAKPASDAKTDNAAAPAKQEQGAAH